MTHGTWNCCSGATKLPRFFSKPPLAGVSSDFQPSRQYPTPLVEYFFSANFILIFVEQYQNNEIGLSSKVCFRALSVGVRWIIEADDRAREQIYETLTRIKAV